VATLYEFWTFLQVAGLVADMCGASFDFGSLFERSPTGLQLNLRRGRTQLVSGWVDTAGRRLHVGLWFNRSFRRIVGESWTRNMRPDVSMGIGETEAADHQERVWVHFDAKYKVEHLDELFGAEDADDDDRQGDTSTAAVREDLLKMHAYKDAIRRSSGAYVLYPGLPSTPATEAFYEFHELLPGLGAFALRPTADGAAHGLNGLRTFIRDILEHVASDLSDDRRGRFWLQEAYGDPPPHPLVAPVLAPRKPTTQFLKKPPKDEGLLTVRLGTSVTIEAASSVLMLVPAAHPELASPESLAVDWILAVAAEEATLLARRAQEPLRTESRDGEVWVGLEVEVVSDVPDWVNANFAEQVLNGAECVLTTWGDVAHLAADG